MSDDIDFDNDSKEILVRVDERTEHIEQKVDTVADSVEKNQTDINELQGQVQTNKTILGGITAGAASVLIWSADKLARWF